jgi:WD repeat-containing protein 19
MLRIGHVRKGMTLALALLEGGDDDSYKRTQEAKSSLSQPVLIECARILESAKATWLEAATLYERAGKDEHAAQIYIEAKALTQAAPLLARVTLPKLHGLFAKACEEEGSYGAAIAGYEKAHDRDSVIRLCLREDPRKAFELVRETASATAALFTAKHCEEVGDMVHCLEFLLLAQQEEQTFEVAKAHQVVDTYVQLLLTQGRDVQHILDYYQQSRAWAAAGRLYHRLGQPAKALPLLLQGGAIEDAIQMVTATGDSSDQRAKDVVVAFLTDGPGKDWRYLGQLYSALGDCPQVVRVALARADEEQANEHYVEARSIVHAALQDLESLCVPMSVLEPVQTRFMVLHSYLLVKGLLRHEHHEAAARLLLRVAKHVACFPGQSVRLLTSVVLQCQRVGMAAAAYQHALLLVADPQYRQGMDAKIRRKVETIVRRQGAGMEEDDGASLEDEATSPCPMCNTFLPLTELECPGPHAAAIPMCVVSGRHMEREDWCICPNSGLPALYSAYLDYIEIEGKDAEDVADPVCGRPVTAAQLVRVAPAEVDVVLAKYKAS